jgi:hypothetical protein
MLDFYVFLSQYFTFFVYLPGLSPIL